MGGLADHRCAFSEVCNDSGRLHSTAVGLQAQVSELEEGMNQVKNRCLLSSRRRCFVSNSDQVSNGMKRLDR
jgi:hypothetical protein